MDPESESHNPSFPVGQIAWEMLEWEVHALRGLLTIIRTDLAIAARSDPDGTISHINQQAVRLGHAFDANQQRALGDAEFRRHSTGATRRVVNDMRSELVIEGESADPARLEEAMRSLRLAIADELSDSNE